MKSDPFFPPEAPPHVITLIELLRWRAQQQPDQQVYTFLEADEANNVSLTYSELDARARAIAAQLQAVSARGERALLLYPPGVEFVAAFFGCLYAGVIAVPAYPPRLNRNLLRVQAIIKDAGATVTMTTAKILSKIKTMTAHVPDLAGMRWLDTESIGGDDAGAWKEPEVDTDDLAFLQYTSGSTGSPKGVMLSHGNLLHNASLVYRALGHGPADKYVSWLPTFHDMGFMAGVLQPLYGGFPVVLMSPASFLQSPIRWLQAISDYKATTSGGPNFAYDLCVRKIPPAQRETLDLSSWSAAFNGAEPIRHETLERFVEAFEPCGFRREVFYPCYGLAEATLIVTGGRKSARPVVKTFEAEELAKNHVAELRSPEDEGARTLVGCGSALYEQKVVIVRPESSERCAPDEVGEIWVSGPSVAQGYWGRPEQSERSFRAHLAETGEGPFLRTEDLGFLHEGELFVAGRIKDLVIIRGRNHYPQDIELTVERSYPALRPGCGAAFSVDVEEEERLVVVQEVEGLAPGVAEAVTEAIRQSVSEEHELQVYAVVLIKPGSVPKTSSGKIQRHACRNGFLAGNLETVESSVLAAAEAAPEKLSLTREGLLAAPPDSRREILEAYLRERVARVLKVPPPRINPQTPVSNLGVDSLMSIELQYDIETALGVSVPMASFLQGESLVSLASQILAQLDAQAGQAPEKSPVVEEAAAGTRAETSPLSYGQRALWFLYHLAPESSAYNISRAVRIVSPLDLEAFRGAFRSLVERHPALRTTFHSAEGGPVQRVHPSAEHYLREEDASGWTEEELRERLAEEARLPFDLENGPPFRVVLYTRSQQERVLLLAMHHIVADFWSLSVLVHELGILYKARKAGAEATLPLPAMTCAEYARWQAELLSGPEGERLWDYWRRQLAGQPEALDLPTDRPRPVVQTYNGSSRSVVLSKRLTETLKDIGRARGATLYMTLLAAFQTLLHRYTGSDDVSVGSPLAGRGRSELAGVVGYFVSPVVMRASLAGDPSFEELLGRVRRVVLEAFEHQDYPFPLLVERLHPQRDPARSPLFQVMFVLQRSHLLDEAGLAAFALGEEGARLSLGELEFASMSLGQRVAQFDLTLMMAETGEGLAASLEYNTDLFDSETVERLLRHFETLLEGIAAGPGRRLSSLPLLPPEERRLLLEEFNDTRTEYPRQHLLHRLIEEQAALTPDAVAVSYGARRLTYRELDEQSNQLARYLQSHGAGPETCVGVLMERAPEMVLSLLAVLKAGAAYLPLDPEYPRERLAFMMEDAGVPLLLTQKHLTESVPASSAEVLCVDSEWPLVAGEYDKGPVSSGVQPGNLAYVIYTSGSTGRPKAAMNEHRAISNRLLWMQHRMPLDSSDAVLQKTPYGFDVSVWEFFWPLLTGARLVLAEPGGHRDPAYLRRLIETERVTTLHFVPSMLEAFLREGGLESACREVRRVVCSGEALSAELQRRFFARMPEGVRLYNLYGPTEAAVDVTCWECERGGERREVPIGAPIANTRLYVLGAGLEPAPVGARGELYIGGVAVGRGYLGRAGLTAERFVPDAHAGEAGARMYRTGDEARWDGGGVLEYLGRVDFQVKLRGQRIELGEVEAALRGEAGVREAVVVAGGAGGGEARLVGYVVLDKVAAANDGTAVSLLKERLRERLPEYMVPSAFVVLDELPLTPNGKVDRKALPEPDAMGAGLRPEYVGAETETERILCEIWSAALGVERVGVHDNFFDLGGDSILSIQVINKARQAGINLTPRHLFQHQTVARLAAAADAQRLPQPAAGGESEQSLVTGALPLTPVQQWFFEQELENPHHWNQALMLETARPLDPALLERALQELLTHHDALRLRFARQDSGWRQFNADASERASFVALDLAALPPEERQRAVAAHAAELQAGLDITRGPLCRAAYFHAGADEPDRLLLVIHHLGVDAVSWRILLEDLEAAYLQLSRGEAVSLPPKTASYKRWAERLVEHAGSPDAAREAAYWLGESEEGGARLPVDSDGGANTEATTQTVSVSLSEEETRSLLQEVPAAFHARINELLLCALAQTLTRWAGGPLPVDLEAHGREEVAEGWDTSRTVGWFTSIFPVRLPAAGGEGAQASSLLKAVKERLRAVPHGGIGYGVLRYLRDDAALRERLRGLPQSEVSFNYLGQLDQVFAGSCLFGQAAQETGPAHDPRGARRYLFDVNGRVSEGRLQLDWTYSENRHRRDTVERLAHEFAAALRSLIADSAGACADCYTASDFPLARLDQPALETLVREHGEFEDLYPLSPIQRGMLFHSLLAPASGVYVEQLSLTLRGELDAAAFEGAWRQAARRHATLRTAFVWENLDQPLQLVRRDAEPPCVHEDWRGLSAEEQRGRLADYLHADRERGFNLSEAPLMRLRLMRLTDETWQLVWSFHHLLLDGWSLPVVLEEVLAFYEAAREGRELKLDSGRPYRDYVEWLGRQELSEAEAFWRRYLEGFHAPTPLVVDSAARPEAAADGERAEAHARLSPSKAAELQAFARRQRLTLNTLLQGAWALVLSRYSGEPEVVFGATVSGRSAELAGAERMVGPFINTVPVRVRTPPDAAASDWLRELQEQQAGLRSYEYTPLVEIQGWSEVPRGLPLFESIFVFENYPVDASLRDLRGSLRIDAVDFFEQTNYPLTLIAVPGDELLLKVMYDSRRFDASAVSRMLSHFENLLAGIVAEPAQPVEQLPLLSESESARLLKVFNETRREYPRDRFIHELFEAQAAAAPEAVALVFEGEALSYAELNVRANRLAHHLRRQGVGPESLVGVLMERSVELVVALLGILKAGGAYVPLDPAYPRERLAYMLEDSRVEVLLTQERLADALPPTSARIIRLDAEWDVIAGADAENPARATTADNLAYVIYTSGSTGRPKGAGNTHGAILNRLLWMQDTYGLTPDDRVLQKTPFSFDVSVWEFFWPLMTGARLVVARPGGHQDSAYLADLIAEQGVTTLHFVPSMLQLFLEESGLERCRGLRRVVCSGEALPFELQQRFFARMPWAELHNLYGPTEAAVDVTFWECRPGGDLRAVPIGRPVANTQIYLLDARLLPVPEGVPGELYIGGIQLARGYHGRPALTAEKFIPDPFSHEPGARLYRTGDLARYLPGGAVEFLGRTDHQVKVRGLRIELGEIEAALAEQPEVRDAVVLAKGESGGDRLLVAYVARAQGRAVSQGELRRRLRERLPEYMVPSAFVVLDELPLTPNGKVDRKALPEPEAARAESAREPATARTPLEATLADIWKDVLGLEEVGVEDNFFELGGHSLRAMQVVTRLRSVLGVDLPLKDLMSAPTVAELARLLEARGIVGEEAARLAAAGEGRGGGGVIPRRGAGEEAPLSFAQQRLWFLSQLQPDAALYNCPAAVRLSGRLDAEALAHALAEIVRRHEILRTNFPAGDDGNPVQRVMPAGPLDPRVVDLRGLAPDEREEEARRLMLEEARTPFDLTRDRLLRVALLKLTDEESVLMLTAHHINVDAWSMGVLVKELAALYEAYSTGSPSPLPELPIQYADFALWQRRWLQGEVLAEQSRYWKGVLSGRLPVLELPADRPRPRQRTQRGERRTFAVGPELTVALNGFSRREGATLYMTLLAAFETLLYRYTRQTDIIVGTAIANRPVDEVGGLIGCFINTLAMRTDFSGVPRFRDVLRRVRESSLGAFAHQDMPFDKLVDELQPERSAGQTPVVQVAFGIQNSPMPALELPGLKLTPVEVDDGVARLDLTLWVEEGAAGLKFAWNYATDLFDAEAVARMQAHYETLLRSILANPDAPVDALEMLTGEEKEQAEARDRKRQESSRQRLLKVRPKPVSAAQESAND